MGTGNRMNGRRSVFDVREMLRWRRLRAERARRSRGRLTAACIAAGALGFVGIPASSASATPIGPSGYAYCGTEGNLCAFTGYSDVAYGANGSFVYLYHVRGNLPCGNATFGTDPAPYVQKACFTVMAPGPYWTYCTTESGTCSPPSGPTEVAFGINGRWYERYLPSGSIACNDATFGDPAPYVHKACFWYPEWFN